MICGISLPFHEEAIDEKKRYFSKKEEEYAYKWFVKYLPFCFQDDKYLIILSEIKELPNMPEKYKADVKKMSAQIEKKQYLKSCMKKTESEKYDKSNYYLQISWKFSLFYNIQ